MPENKARILVVSNTPELVEFVRIAVENKLLVDYAASENAGLVRTMDTFPDVVIVGRLDSPGAVWTYLQELREGWISRHACVLVVETEPEKNTNRILEAENIIAFTGDSFLLAGTPRPFLSNDDLQRDIETIIARKLKERANQFKEAISNPAKFCLAWEQIPGLGAFEKRQEVVLENARKAAIGKKICAISITDNPGGNPAISTDVLCADIHKMGLEPIVHIAFRDRSRNQGESLLFQLAALEVNNLLVLTGDYPSNLGFAGKSKPVFDLDSVNALQMVTQMNRGLEHEIMRKMTRLAPTDFFPGVAFSPFKQMEAEVMGQYSKLNQKIAAGAAFILLQVGYDIRKIHELQVWLKLNRHDIPVLPNVHVLTYPVAKAMHDNNIPGCVVTDKLLSQVHEESLAPDKGREARLSRAAKMYAIFKGMGFPGVYIAGLGLPYESVEYVVGRGEELVKNWPDLVGEFDYPQEGGFYLYNKNGKTGLNLETVAAKMQKPIRPLIYSVSRMVHATVFNPSALLFGVMRRLAKFIDSSAVKFPFHVWEYWNKTALYGCKDCGDCALFDVAYLCPVSQCPKNQRNGPCGGSFEGWCEVFPGEKQCIWVRAYQRLKAHHKEDQIGEGIVPPQDWGLWQTSSWLNYFLGRDHVSKKAGILPPDTKHKTKS